jgi:hypothetical protein
VPGPDEQLLVQARAWAEETALAQGLPAKVADHDVLRDVAALLGLKGGSVAPDRSQARTVEAVVSPPAGADDDVLQ